MLRQYVVKPYPMFSLDGFIPLSLLFGLLGTLFNIDAYGTFEPFLVIVIILFVILTLWHLSFKITGIEIRFCVLEFAVGFFLAGIAAIYSVYLHDREILFSDAGNFYAMASSEGVGFGLNELAEINDGSLAILIWGFIYQGFNILGFQSGPHIGIALNIAMVTLSGLLSLRISRMIFGNDKNRQIQMAYLFVGCGPFFQFLALHLRDSFILFVMTFLVFFWVRFLHENDKKFPRSVELVIANVLSIFALTYLREEFLLVPIGMLLSAGFAIVYSGAKDLPGSRGQKQGTSLFLAIAVIIILISAWLVFVYWDDFKTSMRSGREEYIEMAADQHSRTSLGMAMIVDQSTLVRALLGSLYLFIYPVPVWSGFEGDSIYKFFNSFNAIFFYFSLPLWLMGLGEVIFGNAANRYGKCLYFCIFTTIGFVVAVAITSLENRHFAAFLVPMLLVSTVADFQTKHTTVTYKKLSFAYFLCICSIHFVWALLKG